jgi:hypothetical protein
MTTESIISKFRLYVDDTSELSSSEELALANKIYRRVLADRPWEFLKKTFSGAISYETATGLYYVTLPSDFGNLYQNAQYTHIASTFSDGTAPVVVFVGETLTPYNVVNFSDRRQYRSRGNMAYIDLPNNKLYFTGTPADTSVCEFDYIHVPDDLTLGSTPIFPSRFHDIIYHGMAYDNDIVQRYDKAKSYGKEHLGYYSGLLDDMRMWNSRLIMN